MRFFTTIRWLVSITFLIASVAAVWILFTSSGSEWALRQALNRLALENTFGFDSLKGTLWEGVVLDEIRLQEVRQLPEGTTVRIQELTAKVSYDAGLVVSADLNNGRLRMPNSSPVLFEGSYRNGSVHLNVYNNGLSLSDIEPVLPRDLRRYGVTGGLKGFDLFFNGKPGDLYVTGDIVIGTLRYQSFRIRELTLFLDGVIRKRLGAHGFAGSVRSDEGLFVRDKMNVRIHPSRMVFHGALANPDLILNGTARVDQIDISIGIRGRIDDPQINLSSNPPLSEHHLLVMLTTGRRWRGVEKALVDEKLSPAVAQDFISYFLLGGRSDGLSRALGLDSFEVIMNDAARGVAAKKRVADNLKVGYGVEQRGADQNSSIQQTVSGEVNVTDNLTVGVEQRVTTMQNPDQNVKDDQAVQEDRSLFFKFRKDF